MIGPLSEILQNWNVGPAYAPFWAQVVAVALVIGIGIAANFITKRILLGVLRSLIKLSKYKWDDIFLQQKVFNRLSHIAPALVIYIMAPFALENSERLVALAHTGALIYIVAVGALAVDSFFNAILAIYRSFKIAKDVPIKSFVQVAKLILYLLCIMFVIALMVGQSPLKLLAGLGALTAVIMLVFKDPILGFVAGIQLTTNRMLSVGDWIEMPKHAADGDVEEIALTTVKVRNFDKTITTIPTYAFISDSFKNWRGMNESGGRRIKRAINIDLSSIKFCTEEMLERFSKIQFISEYIDKKKREVSEHNQQRRVDLTMPANGRRLTNIGTFRAYIEAYLRDHPMINQELTFLIRQLPPSEKGLPIEIYVFCTDKRWVQYEGIMADIFDHILSVVPEFDLRVFQNPTGFDLQSWERIREEVEPHLNADAEFDMRRQSDKGS